MKKLKKITISRTENIIAVEPKYASGPGWANTPIVIHIVDNAIGKYRTDCFQPEDQSLEMQLLFRMCAVAHSQMRDAVMYRTKIKRTNNRTEKAE